MAEIVARALRRAVRADRPATASGSPTPTCWIEVERGPTAPAATRPCSAAARSIRESMGQSARDPRRGHARPRDHRRRRPRPLGRRQGRRRRPRRADRRARQGRQPRHDGRRPPRARDRPVDRDHRRQRPDPHRRRRSTATCTSSARRSSTRRSPPGITTLIGGGTGPAEGTKATTVHARRRGTSRGCSRRWTRWPVNVAAARQGQHRVARRRCASSCGPAPAASSCTRTGARRRPRSTPACAVADETGVQVAIHTDTLNEAGYVESTLAAIAGRTIHTYHTEGAGGGHAPDIITRRRRSRTCCRRRPTRPGRTRSTPSTSTSTC